MVLTSSRLGMVVLAGWVFCLGGLRGETASVPLHELPPNTRLAIWGDSITEVTFYPRFVEAYLLACAGRQDIKVCTFGHSGETLAGLLSRQSDLEGFHPTLVTFNYGMNDTQYSPYTEEKGAAFDKTMHDVLSLLDAKGIKLRVVSGPGLVDDSFIRPDFFKGADAGGLTAAQAQNITLGHFSEIGRKAAAETNSADADIHDRMAETYAAAQKVLGPQYTFAKPGSGIHPSANGHLIMAYEILKALTCDGDIGTFNVDMTGGATASAGHKVVSCSGGVLVVESSKYPFCYNYDPNNQQDPESIASILPFLPFTQDLNRLVLKVTHLGAPSAKVTWGSETKEFTSEQLAAGINLLQQFDHTPFDSTFAKLVDAINRKQDFENYMIKLTSNYNGNDNGGNIDANMIATQEQKDAEVKALIVPVQHTIAIVPVGAEDGPPAITCTTMLYPTVGQPFSYQIAASNSPTNFSFAGLPGGLSLDEKTGLISGTPTAAAIVTGPLTATNAKGTTTVQFRIDAQPPLPERPQITSPATAGATVGSPFTYQIIASNAERYFVTSPSDKGTEPPDSSLPPGLTYDTKTGVFSGVPTKAGSYSIVVAAMNESGVTIAPVALTVKDK